MAVRLQYSTGDPDYLKVVVLSETLNLPSSAFTKQDGHLQLSLALDDNGGLEIFSANEVCRFLCGETGNEGFYGEDPTHQALVDYWLGWEASELKAAVKTTLIGGAPSESLCVCLGRLESHMTTCGGGFLVQERLSLADVVIWAALYALLAPESTASSALHKDYPLVCRWFISLARRDQFTSAVWKASDDIGFDAFRDFVQGTRKTQVVAPAGKIGEEGVPQTKGKGQKVHVKPSKPAAGSKSSSQQQVPKKATTTESTHHSEHIPDHVIPAADLKAAKEAWLKGIDDVPKLRKRDHPILPIPGERNILITSALPYVNNVPHLGNIIGCVLSADVFARYCRLCNYNTLYICGTDEYGTATETKALEEKLTPQQICEKYYAIHDAIYKWFNIDFDYFGRTSTPQQTQIAQDIFWRLHERGFITKDKVDQLLCQNCNMFLADRFVEGTCPICGYQDARGDQCDKCGRLINATELKSPRCKMCSNEPKIKTSDHLFLDLSQLAPRLQTWIQLSSSEGQWSSNAEHITSSWVRDGLKPRCITRDLKWGTPVPLEGYQDKVFYVWFDAPIGYLSITACYTDQWERWWKNPQQVENYQFMAKDNVPFHTVVFPCSLLGAEDNYTLLNHISSTEYLNYEDGKFSKSRGIGVFGNDAKDTDIPADVYRFYLLYVRPETQDSAFNWSDFVLKHNSELLNNLGNFVNRVLMFTKNNFKGIVQDINLTERDVEFIAKVTVELRGYLSCLDRIKIRDGLRHILSVSRLGNIHIQENKPWILVKGSTEDRARAGSLLGVCANIVCLLSVMLQPYMPEVSRQIQEQIQAPPTCNILVDYIAPFLTPGHKIGTPSPLFTKIEEGRAQALKERFAGRRTFTSSATTKEPLNVSKEELDKQAALVRQLKAQGDVPKEKIDEEVKKLLDLKSKLGILPAKQTGGKKSKSKK